MTLTVAAYAEALAEMPQHYRELAFSRVSIAMLDDKILAAHPNHKPIIFQGGKWHTLTLEKEIPNERPRQFTYGNTTHPAGCVCVHCHEKREIYEDKTQKGGKTTRFG